MKELEPVIHPFEPIYDECSRVLILGTMASPASRDSGFYYGHKRNRFWPLMAALFDESVPMDIDAKRALLLRNGVALWDVLSACKIYRADDASIQDPQAFDFDQLFAALPGLRVFANGQKAADLYRELVFPHTGVPITALPSTSPANAGWGRERLLKQWSVVSDQWSVALSATWLHPRH